MHPKRIKFTEAESKELGEYLDQFVALGPLEALPEEKFRDVQVLVAKKIWQLRPDIVQAIQAVADADQPPALLIENVPVEDNLPPTPNDEREYGRGGLTPSRSHYFNAGVGLIRYGHIIPMSAVQLYNGVNLHDRICQGYIGGRPMHRDIYTPNIGDIALHMHRENPEVGTPLVSIDEIPAELANRLKKATFTYDNTSSPIIQNNGEGWRFHPHFKNDTDIPNVDDKEAAKQFFTWMESKAMEEPIVLRNQNFLLIDQSRAFHGVTGHAVILPHENDRWFTHTRFEVSDGVHHRLEGKTPFYLLPDYITILEEAAKLEKESKLSTSRRRPDGSNISM